MAEPTTISLSKFTSSVQAAVKAAAAKHPKFKMELPHGITVPYLIWGFPVPEVLLGDISVGEAQAFANDVANQIAGAHPEAFSQAAVGHKTSTQGAILSVGGHLIIGIPPVMKAVEFEK